MSAITLTRRDHDFVRAAWSLGWVTASVLRDVIAPTTSVKTIAGRLAQLAAVGYLRRRRIVAGPQGHLWLYGAGRAAPTIDPGYADAWRPRDAQLAHTLAAADILAALHTPGRLGAIRITGWRGEAELRAWHVAGDPVPDLLIEWTDGTTRRAWAIEVDRGTQARGAWRRKLVRYLDSRDRDLFAITTSDERARNIARLARDVGAPALTTDRRTLHAAPIVEVYDAVKGCRRSVDDIAR